MSKDQNHLDILRQIDKNPKTNQRSLAKKLGLSLGKLNYCLKELFQYIRQQTLLHYLDYCNEFL